MFPSAPRVGIVLPSPFVDVIDPACSSPDRPVKSSSRILSSYLSQPRVAPHPLRHYDGSVKTTLRVPNEIPENTGAGAAHGIHPMADVAVDFRTNMEGYLTGLKAVLDALSRDDLCDMVDSLHRAHEEGRHVFVIGNGGSAATASHMACDLQKTVLGTPPRPGARRLKITALTDSVPLLTAWGNDAGYETVFAQQLENVANEGDLLVVITASGNSRNVVEAVKTARTLGLHTIGLLGFDGGRVKDLLDQAVIVSSDHYGHIEDAHLVVNHLITTYFQQLMSQ